MSILIKLLTIMYNVIKFQAPFERLKFYSPSPEIALRRAIILQAIIDATNTSTTREGKKIAKEAQDWLFGSSEEFQQTCLEADLEQDVVVKKAKEAIELKPYNDNNKANKNKKEAEQSQELVNLITNLTNLKNMYIYYTRKA